MNRMFVTIGKEEIVINTNETQIISLKNRKDYLTRDILKFMLEKKSIIEAAQAIAEKIISDETSLIQEKDEEIDKLLEEKEKLELINKKLIKDKYKTLGQLAVLNKIAGGIE